MATIKVVSRPSKEDEAGTIPLYLRVAHANHTRYLSLGVRVSHRLWNRRSRRVRSGHPDEDNLNAHLAEVEATAQRAAERALRDDPTLSPSSLKGEIDQAVFGPDQADDFLIYAREYIEQLKKEDRHSTVVRVDAAIDRVEEYHRSQNEMAAREECRIGFDEVTLPYLRSLIVYCKEQGLATNTIAGYMTSVRTIYYRAMEEGKAEGNPWRHIRIKTVRKQKDPLTREEFEKLRALDLEGGGPYWHARNYFVFAVYALGMRFGDVATLQPKNVRGGRLRYSMRKNEKQVDAKLVSPARKILELYDEQPSGYIFPILTGEKLGTKEKLYRAINRSNSRNNGRLKKIAGMANINKRLSFHVARDTFTALALEVGRSIRWIQNALRHSSLATTDRYVRSLRNDELDEGIDDIF